MENNCKENGDEIVALLLQTNSQSLKKNNNFLTNSFVIQADMCSESWIIDIAAIFMYKKYTSTYRGWARYRLFC